ncbi:MAG: RND transporter, partial [Alphaproteobacteria bacterium]|nr:RND transporter [Alphaproteobacteria bacterium]
MTDPASEQQSTLSVAGLHKLGFVGISSPILWSVVFAIITVVAALGIGRLQVDDSLSELFRSDTKEFRQYEEIDKRFPSSEYDVLVVVEGKDLLKRQQLTAFGEAAIELQLADGVEGIVSMLSARGKPDATGYAAPLVPDELPEDAAAYDQIIKTMRDNDIVKGKFLSDDGELALIVLALDRQIVKQQTARVVIGGIKDTITPILNDAGLRYKLTGAPVMQLEIR